MRRVSIFQLVLYGVVAGAIATAVAVFIPWLPTPASREAGRIDFAYWFATIISLVVFAVVAAVMTYALVNFRAKPGDLSDGPPTHGNTKLEIIWTIIPTILVTAIAVVNAIVLAKDSHAGPNPLVVKVYGVQFAWEFEYPNGYKTGFLHLSVDRGVKLQITSKDVLHSFWVPQFGQKQDAVPGQWNDLIITPDRIGTYPVICTELCGLGHSVMRSSAIVQSTADFNSWYASTNGGSSSTGAQADAAKTFNSLGCSGCHTLTADPAARGKVGPDLDTVSVHAKAAGLSVQAYIQQSITDPAAYVAPGVQGAMPPGLAAGLSDDQLAALVQYIASNTK